MSPLSQHIRGNQRSHRKHGCERRHFALQSRPRLPRNRRRDKRTNASRRVKGRPCQHHYQTASTAQHVHSRIHIIAEIKMNEPPRKRRRTSSPAQASSSPLRKPPRRPSFASPTKASLARSYPNLLPTRTPPRDYVRLQGKQAPPSVLGADNTPPRETEALGDEDMELPATPSQREQDGPRRGILFSSPSKRPPRAPSAVKQSPLAEASPIQQNQLTRPVEEALDTEGLRQTEKGTKLSLDPEIEKRKREKARLQRELEELEAQVSRCTKEIVAEQQRGVHDTLPPAQRADLM